MTCSFNDYQLSELIKMNMRLAGKLPVMKAVAKIEPQEDRSWVLGHFLYFVMVHISKILPSAILSNSNSIFAIHLLTPNRKNLCIFIIPLQDTHSE